MRYELSSEQLTALPKRLETRRWGRGGGNFNFAAVEQNNYSAQLSLVSLHGVQANDQLNLAIINQE